MHKPNAHEKQVQQKELHAGAKVAASPTSFLHEHVDSIGNDKIT